MARVRIDLNPAGIRAAALTSAGVRSEVTRVAEGMAASVRSASGHEVKVINGGRSRARSYVRLLGADALAAESKGRYLGRALRFRG